jgi:hypothetical protein
MVSGRRGGRSRSLLPTSHVVPAAAPARRRQQLLGEPHHVLVVEVRGVELQHGELGVVEPVHPLVAEVLADLVHPLHPAHDQPLQVQLVRDAEVERHVERVVVRHEGARRAPP